METPRVHNIYLAELIEILNSEFMILLLHLSILHSQIYVDLSLGFS